MKRERRRTHKVLWGFIYVTVFVTVFIASAVFKMKYDPTHGAYKADSVSYTHLTLPTKA